MNLPRTCLAALVVTLTAATAHAGTPERILALVDRAGVPAAVREAKRARMSEADRDRLLGHLHLRARDLDLAAEHLERAVERAPGQPAAWLELALVHHLQGDPKASLQALERGRALGQDRASFFALAAENLRQLDDRDSADRLVTEGLGRFEGDVALLRLKVGLLLDLEAAHAAADLGAALIVNSPDPDRERRWLARKLVAAGAPRRAATLLEVAVAEHPDDLGRAAELAWAYAEAGQPRVAARRIDPRRGLGARFAYEAAEQYRAAGALQDTLRVNAFVSEPARRQGQRIVILVEAGQLERAAAAGATVDEATLDDAPRFALAFAAAYTGRPARALRLLDRLREPERFADLPALRAALEGARR